jgi:TrmH family RNA methyltransferase
VRIADSSADCRFTRQSIHPDARRGHPQSFIKSSTINPSIRNAQSAISNSPYTKPVPITSRQNPLVARFRDAARGDLDDRILLDGAHLVQDALRAGLPIDVAAFAEDAAEGSLAQLVEDVRRSGTTVALVSRTVLEAMSPVRRPAGVVALAKRPAPAMDEAFAVSPQLVVALADVQDPGNVGAMIRAAEGCGATGVVALERTADPFGWKALRGAMGSTFRIPVVARQPLAAVVEHARRRRLRVLATVPRDGTPLPRADLRRPCAIFLGGEGAGLAPEFLDQADDRLTIPMRAGIESLNVAVAGGIVLYEAARQRMDQTDVAVR